MKRQTIYIIVIDICSLRLKSELRGKSSLQTDVLDLEQMAADASERSAIRFMTKISAREAAVLLYSPALGSLPVVDDGAKLGALHRWRAGEVRGETLEAYS
jgi:hypothetical protein